MEHKHEWLGGKRLVCECGAEAVRTSGGRLVLVTKGPAAEVPQYPWVVYTTPTWIALDPHDKWEIAVESELRARRARRRAES